MHDGPPALRNLKRWTPALALLGLWLFQAANNWIWLSKNVTSIGWDRLNALVNSLLYNQTLSHFSLNALFKASIQDEIRPPLFGTSMALMYKIFGVDRDVAVMVNVVYLGFLLWGSYALGKQMGGRKLGLLSATLTVLMPLVFAMSRYSYFEFALTALVALTVYLLLASNRFQNRTSMVLLGVVLGLGTLVKRTFPVFVVGALAVVVLQSGLIQKLWARMRARPWPRIHWRAAVLALAGGLALSALWYFPNRHLAQTLPAGPWLFPVWWALATITIYFLQQPSSVEINALTAGALAVSIASLWYVPHANFIDRALRVGWGINDPRGPTANPLNPATYVDYFQSIVLGLSLVYLVSLLLLAVLLIFFLMRHRRRLKPSAWPSSNWGVIAASVVVPFLILSSSKYHEDRAITPILPFLALILAAMLLKLPWRRLRTALVAFVLLFGLLQFVAISHTGPHSLVDRIRLPSPVLGQTTLFAQGAYLETPDSGSNDPGYWIVDDVLGRVEATRQDRAQDTITLGVLAENSYVHTSTFAYDLILHYPAIKLVNPIQTYPMDSLYSMAFRHDYLVVLDQHNEGETLKAGVNLILNERRPFFDLAFELEAIYALPNQDTVYLFRRRYPLSKVHDGDALYNVGQYLHEQISGEDLLVVMSPDFLDGLLESYWGPAPILTLSGAQTLSQGLAGVAEPYSRVFVLDEYNPGTGGPDKDLPAGLIATQVVPFDQAQVTILERPGP